MIIDATNLILGRMAAFAAKKALLGEKIDIVNCEKTVVTGTLEFNFGKYKRKFNMGAPLMGPYHPRYPDRIVRRTIRGMLPYRRERGEKAFKNVMCYRGVPVGLKDKKFETIKEANVSKVPSLKYTTLEEVSKLLGAKV